MNSKPKTLKLDIENLYFNETGYPRINTPDLTKFYPNRRQIIAMLDNQINYHEYGENFIELIIPIEGKEKEDKTNLCIFISDKKIAMYENEITLGEAKYDPKNALDTKVISKNFIIFDKPEDFKIYNLYKYINNYFKRFYYLNKKVITRKEELQKKVIEEFKENYYTITQTFNLTSKSNVASFAKIESVKEFLSKLEGEEIVGLKYEEEKGLIETYTKLEVLRDKGEFNIVYKFPKKELYWSGLIKEALGIDNIGYSYEEKLSFNKFIQRIYNISKDLNLPVTKSLIKDFTQKYYSLIAPHKKRERTLTVRDLKL